MDADGDGCGDLSGLRSRLDYLEWLGVDAIWLSPIFPSPMADFGYDVADYLGIDPLFGSPADFADLLAEAHRRGLKLILDFVPNHTSSQHPWFQAASASRHDPRRDWYIWRDPAPDGGPPNNWLSVFGGSAWAWHPAPGQYYYHAYLAQQPDLNWRNPEVQRAMLDVLRTWLERGVDGFRIDALRQLIKDDQLRDNPPNPDRSAGQNSYASLLPVYTTDRPELLELLPRWRELADAFAPPERLLIGELYLPIERLVAYYGRDGRGLHLPFNFHLILTPWQAEPIGRLIRRYEAALPPGAWPNWVLGNHDNPRLASRVGARQARVAAMLLLTLRGTPTLYYGDELGMADVAVPPEAMRDPVGRDPERTPMQWDAGPHAGFTRPEALPWLPLAEDYRDRNVAAERQDPRSMLSLHRRLIELRRGRAALTLGGYRQLACERDVLLYARGDELWVALNFAGQPRPLALPGPARVLLSTYLDEAGDTRRLRADEGLLLEPQ
jgi:alpha-glucosidase